MLVCGCVEEACLSTGIGICRDVNIQTRTDTDTDTDTHTHTHEHGDLVGADLVGENVRLAQIRQREVLPESTFKHA